MENLNRDLRNNYCVILAGGRGIRVWPWSRERKPKQFIDFFGSRRTQLQQTYDRFARFMPKENIFVNTDEAYVAIVKEQLPELDDFHIMAEPVHRNTAPSTAWATLRVLSLNADANLVVSPSDQAVLNEEAFRANILAGCDFVSSLNCVLTIGVRPTRPEPGYGYIQMGERLGGELYKVKAFTEKPQRAFATMFMQSGEFLWNTGLFIANARHFDSHFHRLFPNVYTRLHELQPESEAERNEVMSRHFSAFKNVSMDSGILEKRADVYVMRGDFGWADLGTWHGIYEAESRFEDDNVMIDCEAMMDNSHNNIVKVPRDRLAVISGLDGYIVAEYDNVLLICRKEDSSAQVRKFVTELKMRHGDQFI